MGASVHVVVVLVVALAPLVVTGKKGKGKKGKSVDPKVAAACSLHQNCSSCIASGKCAWCKGAKKCTADGAYKCKGRDDHLGGTSGMGYSSCDVLGVVLEMDVNNFSLVPRRAWDGAQRLAAHFNDPLMMMVFGNWSRNATYLQEMNAKLVRGYPVFVDNFLNAEVARDMYVEFLQAQKELRAFPKLSKEVEKSKKDMTPFNKSTFANDYSKYQLADVRQKCEILFKHRFQFNFRILVDDRRMSNHTTATRVNKALRSGKFKYAVNELITNSGFKQTGATEKYIEDSSPAGTDSFREWYPGDYILMHNDFVGTRVLSMNIWLATPDWREEYGGNLVQCGYPPHTDAFVALPAFNQAAIFIPNDVTSWHAVEPISMAIPETHTRFSWTLFLELPSVYTSKALEFQNEFAKVLVQERGIQVPSGKKKKKVPAKAKTKTVKSKIEL